MPFFTRPDFSLHYEVVDGVLPHDTLFLHGNLASNVWWEPALTELKKESGNGRAILMEWRGCGQSKSFQGSLNLTTLARDAVALLDHLGLSAVDLVGHSTGGLIGLHAMAQSPERFRKGLLLDTVAPDGVQFGPEMLAAFQQMSQDRDFCAAVILGTIHGGAVSEELKAKIVDSAFGVASAIWKGVPEMLHNPPALPLERITHPVLVAHGAHDAVLPIEKSEKLASDLPQGRFRSLSERGHCTNVEDPGLFVELLKGFF